MEEKESNASGTDYIKAKELFLSLNVRNGTGEKVTLIFFFFTNVQKKLFPIYPYFQFTSAANRREKKERDKMAI